VTDFQDFAEKVADFQKNPGPLAKKEDFQDFAEKVCPPRKNVRGFRKKTKNDEN